MFDKSLYQAPQGVPDAEPLDIQIADDPSVQHQEDGSVVVDLSGESSKPDMKSLPHDANLAEHLDDTYMRSLADELMTDVEDDLRSRSEWEKTYRDGLKLLGLTIEHRSEPWDGACGIVHPILAEAVVRFQAELATETFPAAGPVKTKILGVITPDKEDAAARVRDDMNIEITDRMTEFRSEHERLLWNLPISGCALKKVYFDPTLGRQVSMFVAAEDFIVSYGASDLATCSRYTHRLKKTSNEVKKLMVSGFYRDIELGDPTEERSEIRDAKDKISGISPPSAAEHHTIYEINVDLDLQGAEDSLGIALPYVVSIDKDSQQVLSIRRNFDENDQQRKKKQYFVKYGYVPGFGFYDLGLIHLVGGFAEGATSILRQLVDAGTLSNLPGGLKTRGLRVKGDDTPIGPGEWRDVDVPGGTLKENLMPLPYKEPSAVLAQLLDTIVEEGRKFAAVAEMKVADFDSNSPVGTTMALLERTLKVMASVQARIYEAMKLEFRLIKDLIRDYGTAQYEYDPESGDRTTKKADYAMVDVLPVADPNAATMSQRIVQWQAVMQLAQMQPQIYDMPELHAQMLDILGVRNIDKLIPARKVNNNPVDPVTENMAILNMQPVKAYIYQDHMSHIQVHQSAMQDPKIQQMVGQNPMAQQIQAAAMAHIMEHVAYQYRAEMEQMMGTQLPTPDQPLPPQLEGQLSRAMVQAAQQLLGKDQNEAAAAAAQQAAQDPVLQQQQADTKVKQDEVDRKKARDAADIALKQKELDLKEREINLNSQGVGAKLGADIIQKHLDRQHDAGKHSNQLGSTERQTAFKSASDLTKQDLQMQHQQQMQQRDHTHQAQQQTMDHANQQVVAERAANNKGNE